MFGKPLGLRGPIRSARGKASTLAVAALPECLARYNASDELNPPKMPPGFVEDESA